MDWLVLTSRIVIRRIVLLGSRSERGIRIEQESLVSDSIFPFVAVCIFDGLFALILTM